MKQIIIKNKIDIALIYYRTGIKLIRGFFKSIFFKRKRFPLLVGKGVHISHSNHIICGRFVKFEDFSEIHGLSCENIIFGDYVTIGRGTMIRPSSYYGIDLGKGIEIGNHSSIGPYSYVGCAGKVVIGENVMIGPRCNIFPENHIFADGSIVIKNQGVQQKGIIIEDNCWVGGDVTILDGVRIGYGSVIGAGTLISKSIPPMSVVIDKRQKQIKNRSKEEDEG